jgi:Ssp1 endopeptidase immunity protein Rap1a
MPKRILFAMAAIIVFITSVASPSDVRAAPMTGNELLAYCDDVSSSARQVGCITYVLGVVDSTVQAGGFCLPEGVKGKQLSDVAAQYIRDHPTTRHLPAHFLILQAMIFGFPCSH